MKTKRKYFYLDDFEQRLLVGCLMTTRNKYLQEGKSTEDVNSLILKIIDAATDDLPSRDCHSSEGPKGTVSIYGKICKSCESLGKRKRQCVTGLLNKNARQWVLFRLPCIFIVCGHSPIESMQTVHPLYGFQYGGHFRGRSFFQVRAS